MIALVTIGALIASLLGVGIISYMFYLAERIDEQIRRKHEQHTTGKDL